MRRDVNQATVEQVFDGARREGREQLTLIEALAVLDAYGIPCAAARLATRADELLAAGDAVGYPLAMKLASPDITHKTDVGGVRLGLATPAALRAAWEAMMAEVRRKAPDARIEGVLLQRMVEGGRETIAGIARDPSFGPQLMFGLGGIFVEALQDVVFRIAPIDDAQARDMVHGVRGISVLRGLRGAAPVDEVALTDALCRLGQLAADFPQVAELDINPLLAFERGVIAVDARVRLAFG